MIEYWMTVGTLKWIEFNLGPIDFRGPGWYPNALLIVEYGPVFKAFKFVEDPRPLLKRYLELPCFSLGKTTSEISTQP